MAGGMNPTFLGGIGAVVLGAAFQVIGLVTPDWSTNSADLVKGQKWSMGLFRSCSCSDISNFNYETDSMRATRAMEIIGVIAAAVAVGLLLLYAICHIVGRSFLSKTYLIASICCFIACLFIIIGVIIWATKVNHTTLGYSFALSIVGAVLLFAGGLMVYLTGRHV